MIRGAVFDMDGTLLDTMPLWDRAGEIYLASLGVKAQPDLGRRLFSAHCGAVGEAYQTRIFADAQRV
jgi:beta-phosphoglucomutase-like phosphatase (HAD superfamily)